MIITPRILAADGSPQVLQKLVQPGVYLDTWALIALSEDVALGERFRKALERCRGTLFISTLTFADFAGMDDPRHTELAATLIDSVMPNVFCSTFDPFKVQDLEWKIMTGQTRESPAGDPELLKQIAADVVFFGGKLSVRKQFAATYADRTRLRTLRDKLGLEMFHGLDALRGRLVAEPDLAKDLRNALKDAARPRSTHALLRALIADLQGDRALKPNPNTGIDLMHCVVPAAYGRYVLVDKQWFDRLNRARERIEAAGISAKVAVPFTERAGGLEAFLDALESEPPVSDLSPGAHPG